MYYRQLGENSEAIFILHGIFGSGDNWQSIAQALSIDYSVYLVDLRNHGRSEHLNDFDLDLMVEDLRALMDQCALHKIHLLGHSMGGKVCLRFLENHPDLLQKIIIIDIAPKYYKRGHDEIFQVLLNFPFDEIQNRNQADTWVGQFIPDFGVRQFILKNLHRNEDGKFNWKLNVNSIYKNYENILIDIYPSFPNLKPILFIKGANSYYISDTDWINIKEHYPNATIQNIANAGHWVHADNPTNLLDAIKKYLN